MIIPSRFPSMSASLNRCFFLLYLTLFAVLLHAVPAHATGKTRSIKLDQTMCASLRSNGVLHAHAPIGCERLQIVHFSYIGFDGKQHDDGKIMVMDAVAPQVAALFDQLRARGFALAGARLMQHYRGDDQASMRANNTSAFNDRAITNASAPSLHAYGLAIDINPVQNPFVEISKSGHAEVSPAAGGRYLNRQTARPGKPARKGMAEDVVELFAQHGFTIWGGDWDAPIDYQHFQVSRTLARQLAASSPAQAAALFEQHVQVYRNCRRDQSRAACAH